MLVGVCIGAAKLGFCGGLDYIEPSVAELLCPAQGDTEFAAKLSAFRAAAAPPKAVNCLIPADMKCTGHGVDMKALDAYIATVCKRAAKAGVKTIVFGSGGSRRVPEGYDKARAAGQIVGHLKRWGLLAISAGVTIVVEPLHTGETNIINSVDEGGDIVHRAGHPNIRLLIDTYHMAKESESPDSIRRAGKLIAHAHCAEADGRGPLGTKGENHRPYFRALKDVGYAGKISIEASWTDMPTQLPAALSELRKQIETA